MDKKFIEELKQCKVGVEYQWSSVGDGEYESYILRDADFNRMLMLSENKSSWRLTFLEHADKLNGYDNDVTFKILEVIKNKMN